MPWRTIYVSSDGGSTGDVDVTCATARDAVLSVAGGLGERTGNYTDLYSGYER